MFRAGPGIHQNREEVKPSWDEMVMEVPSGDVKIAIENHHFLWIFPLKMVMFHSYVSLPEGIQNGLSEIMNQRIPTS